MPATLPASITGHRTLVRSIAFTLQGEHIALHQLLKLVGVADSGGAAKAMVAAGAVRVDGGIELRKACKIRSGQQVRCADVTIDVVG